MLQAESSNFLLVFSLLEYAVHKASYIRSKFPHFAISSNINSQQNGAKMYPSHDVTSNSIALREKVYSDYTLELCWDLCKHTSSVAQNGS